MQSLFEREGADAVIPTRAALSPWASDRLHGGPILGLLTQAGLDAVADPALQLARVTVDLFAPVPNERLELRVSPLRTGRRIQVVQASLLAADREVSRGTVVCLRPTEGSFRVLDQTLLPGPDGLATRGLISERRTPEMRPGFHLEIETRWPARVPGEPKAIWFRMPLALIKGVALDPRVSAVALSDFNNAVTSIMAYEDGRASAHINVDATMYFERPPVGEWFCLVADRQSDADGISIAQVTHYDVKGRFGRSIQARLENRFDKGT